ncbi:EAL domain-containing protein [Luteimonas sp. RD2P54]|uniref:EAL domain-containing protein n=1 Tax=Luteimonas endophytica TaxID=3042023 RepID=A0ABT6J9D2_9GAMM|nr:EAL domain-containing protein [Luteimonas endophytica]MDH5823421.1 EAL domain-containing protein [Luteimonas endophytica]
MNRGRAAAHAAEAAGDPIALAAALEAAAGDATLPSATRRLLADAGDALRAAASDAESSQLRYRALFDAVPDPVSILDERGIVLDLNRAGMAAYRRSRDEIVGQPIEVLNPDLPENHLQPVLETLRRGGTYVIEVTNMRGDGSRFPVEVHSAGFVHEGSRCIVAVARDLSARREAESRYGQLLEVIDKGVLVQDAEDRPLQVNAAAMRILGVEDEHSLEAYLAPEKWTILDETGRRVPPEELPARRTLRSGQATQSTVLGLYHKPERRLRWLSVTTVPLFAPGSRRPHQVISFFSDVTRLKRDSALFSRAQALARIGGWEWEAGRDVLYLTGEATRILDQPLPPTTMEGLLHCLRQGDRARFGHALQQALHRQQPIDLELQGRRSDGRMLWMRIIGEPESDESANVSITGTLQDISERKQAEETLRVQARTDPLTGLLNRDAILAEMGARMDDAAQSRLAVLYLDLDRFKMVNDVLGHGAGDELLRHAAQRIAEATGPEGLIARFGGDEFLVVCALADDPERPERIARRILEAFEGSFRYEGEEFDVTASIGIARAPEDGERPQTVIQSADAAMYDSKRRVRNGWQAYSPALAQSREDRLRMETHLRRAVDNGEFHLVYQPQVDMRKGSIVAAEALIRWKNHQLGEMRPDHFIGHAETTGDIVRIGRWVLSEACQQVAAWRDAGLGIVRVAVNVSYRQFLGDDLAGTVRGVLDEFRLPGAALELEFTERALIEDAPDTLRTFAALREMGVVLTIDDFGEGYSALNYLRRLPIHGMKLSQLFVEGVPRNHSDVAVCQAVAGIARSLGLGLVAEGVESEPQRQFLLELGVPVGQGFLFAPGLSADEFAHQIGAGLARGAALRQAR